MCRVVGDLPGSVEEGTKNLVSKTLDALGVG